MSFLVSQTVVVLVDIIFDLLFTTSHTPENTRMAAIACIPLNTASPTMTLTVTDTSGCT